MIDHPRLLRHRSSSPAASAPATSDLIPSLPDDLAILCIARVPRSHHPFLTSVSRAWRALLRSPLLFSVRLEVGASQPFLFINLRSLADQSSLWYILDRSLPRNHAPPFIPLPAPPLPSIFGITEVSLGYSLFLLGGALDGIPSSVVRIYDARFNSWRLGPRMSASREHAAACVSSGRIYVVGGCRPTNEYWAEEFDPEKERWRRVPSPRAIRRNSKIRNAVIIEGKLLAMRGDQSWLVFDPAVAAATETKLVTLEKAWTIIPMKLDIGWPGRAAVVGEVLYSYSYQGKIKGYDFKKKKWRVVEGLDEKLPKFFHGVELTNLGEVLCFVGEGRRWCKQMRIICAGVKVIKTDNGGLQGSIEWLEKFSLAFSTEISFEHCILLEF